MAIFGAFIRLLVVEAVYQGDNEHCEDMRWRHPVDLHSERQWCRIEIDLMMNGYR